VTYAVELSESPPVYAAIRCSVCVGRCRHVRQIYPPSASNNCLIFHLSRWRVRARCMYVRNLSACRRREQRQSHAEPLRRGTRSARKGAQRGVRECERIGKTISFANPFAFAHTSFPRGPRPPPQHETIL